MGTRPEGIKLAPVVTQLTGRPDFHVTLATTGQHHEMLDVVLSDFGLSADMDLDIFRHAQELEEITAKALTRVTTTLREARPDGVIVQGDTTSAFAAALAGFYSHVPVIHVEAGLRTNDRRSPFPEEMNRRLITQLADLHLAPTWNARDNLIREGVTKPVVVTGNTVIDAFLWASQRKLVDLADELLDLVNSGAPYVVVTAHRRESWGEPMRRIGAALAAVAARHLSWRFVIPMHSNPKVRKDLGAAVGDLPNVLLTESLPYLQFCYLIAHCAFVATDSGGVQEEAPSLGRPVLVLRGNTERPEGVEAGTVRVIGTDRDRVDAEIERLITDPGAYAAMAEAINPYGDGRAAERTCDAVRWSLRGGPPPEQFLGGITTTSGDPVEPGLATGAERL